MGYGKSQKTGKLSFKDTTKGSWIDKKNDDDDVDILLQIMSNIE